MIRPYLNEDQRLSIKHDTLNGAFAKMQLELAKYERCCYKKYWIFGYFIYRYNVKLSILNPLNAEIKRNWI